MRLRLAVLAAVLAAGAAAVLPASGAAAPHPHPHHNRGLTIHAAPDPVLAGGGVLIYGQLNGSPNAGQTIILYHHIAGSGRGYTRIGTTTTTAQGFYEFTRAEGVVESNRNWFVRQAGVHGIHSRTLRERVQALVSVAASTTTPDTSQPVTFTGSVRPNHGFERVFLQRRVGSSDDFRTIKTARLGAGSNYAITYRFRTPGDRDIRVMFGGDVRNVQSASDPVTITVQQKQIAGFSIESSKPVSPYGQPVTISGVLDQAGSTAPQANATVQLWGHPASGGSYAELGTATTGGDGRYSFVEMPQVNMVYQVRTAFAPIRHSAVLWQGSQDVVSMSASATTTAVGSVVTFSGTVTPDKAREPVYLERLGADGDWHPVEVRFARANSTFQFSWRFAKAGSDQFRARIYSDGQNVGSASAPVTITVSGVAPVGTLPQSY